MLTCIACGRELKVVVQTTESHTFFSYDDETDRYKFSAEHTIGFELYCTNCHTELDVATANEILAKLVT